MRSRLTPSQVGIHSRTGSRSKVTGAAALLAGVLLALPMGIPSAMADPVDDFTPVTPIAGPSTPDEEFFNMRLEFFLPETEPLIKETFGSTLRFEDTAFWEYPSYYSRTVSFATNLPTLAKIDYGPTDAYGMSTEQTESYFYQHVLYLTGLTPGTTYHYQIKVKGSDGAFLASENKVFTTPALPSDVILIPQDIGGSAPYRLTQANAKYLLTQDLTVPNGGIVIAASNVELDLGGHTISYDNAPNPIINETSNTRADFMYGEQATFGVRSGLWNFTNQRIFNGTIVQGANGGAGINGTGYNPVYSVQTSNLEVAGITADYYGDNINGIDVTRNVSIHHNVVYDRGTGIDARDLQMRAITADPNADQSGTTTAYNSVRRCRQVGITTGGHQFSNEVYGDSYSTNSFLVSYASNSLSENNKIFGLGYMPIGIGGGDMTNATAKNNFIYLNAYAPEQRFDEYGRTSGAAGFRPQVYTHDGTYVNNSFENNVVVLKAWPGAAYIRGLWVASDTNQTGMVVVGNTVKAEAMTDDIEFNDGDYSFSCIEFQGWDQETTPPVVLFANNRLITNLTFVAFGSGYGIGNNGSFYNTTFEKIDHNSGFFTPIRMGFWFWDSINNKIIDSTTGPGVDLSAPPRNISYDTINELALDIGVSSTRAYAVTATGALLANTVITWVTDGGDSGSFMTDSNGEAYLEWITTHNRHNAGDPGRTISQVQNTTVTFTAAGFDPVTKAIADIKGTGPDILFGPPAPTVTDVVVSPGTVDVQQGTTQQFSATVNGTNNPSQGVTWEVLGGSAGTTISATGVLSVAASETATTLTVKATSTLDDTVSGTATVTVVASPVAPGITGPATMTLTLGYAATSTSAFTITGTAPVTVITGGDPALTWNANTRAIDIAAGLGVGTYPVTVSASNGTAPDATFTFTLTVLGASGSSDGQVNAATGGSVTNPIPWAMTLGAIVLCMGVLLAVMSRRRLTN